MLIHIKFEVLLQSFSVILSLVSIIFLLIKGKKSLLLSSYICCQSLVFIWSIGQILEIFSTNTENKFMCVKIESLSFCFLGLSWLVFSLIYTNNKLIKSPKKMAIILIIPLIEYLFFLTNDYHKLVYTVFEFKIRSYGPVFWSMLIVNYISVAIGTILLIHNLIKQIGQANRKSILLIMAVLIPVIANIVHVLKIVNIDVDITPVSFAFTLFFLGIAVLKYKFLNIIPIALNKIVNTVEEAIIVIDYFDSIIFYNELFLEYFKDSKVGKNSNIDVFIEYIKDVLVVDKSSDNFFEALKTNKSVIYDGEICVNNKMGIKYFNIKIRHIKLNSDEVLGRIVTFYDVCEYVNLVENLNAKNKELLEANKQLKKFAEVREELAIVKERNRFAIDLHDTLGHTMTLLLKLNEASIITCREDELRTEAILKETYLITKEGMKELRRAITGLNPSNLEPSNLSESLKNLIYNFERSGMKVELLINGVNNYCKVIHSEAIYRTCQEALTNSMRHGNSTKVNIFIKFSENRIKLYIIDNGLGCKDLTEGYGLKGMKERIEKVKGSIVFGSDGESGFNIHIEIPLEEELLQ